MNKLCKYCGSDLCVGECLRPSEVVRLRKCLEIAEKALRGIWDCGIGAEDFAHKALEDIEKARRA